MKKKHYSPGQGEKTSYHPRDHQLVSLEWIRKPSSVERVSDRANEIFVFAIII